MEVIQIPKNKSISFNEYLHNIINNTTTNFASDWGFFVSTDDQINPTKPIIIVSPDATIIYYIFVTMSNFY